MKNKALGFTLVELVVVITILVVLGTVGMVSYSGYSSDARDSARITDMTNIYGQLDMARGNNGSLPFPESYRTISMTASPIAYQGYAKKKVLTEIKFDKGGRDPKDDVYYTYTTNSKRTQAQLMGYFEEYDTNKMAHIPEIGSRTFADTIDYSDRKIGVLGKFIGTLVNSDTQAPIQDMGTGTIEVTTSTGYTAYFNNTHTASGSLQTAFIVNSVIYASIAPSDAVCGAANGSISTIAPTTDLCSSGTPTVVSGTITWSWSCNPAGSGAVANCTASTYAGVFAPGNEYTANWTNNTCNSPITVVDVASGTGTIPVSLDPNTVYKLAAWDYYSPSTIYMANCSAIIGSGSGATKIWYTSTNTGTLLDISSKQNVIASSFSVNRGVSAAPMAVGIGISNSLDSTFSKLSISGAGGDYIPPFYVPSGIVVAGSSRITASSINMSIDQGSGIRAANINSSVFSNISMTATGGVAGVNIDGAGTGNTFSDMKMSNFTWFSFLLGSHNSVISGIKISNGGPFSVGSNNNFIKNITVGGSSSDGITFGGGATGNQLSNIVSYNNGQMGVGISGSNNTINNVYSFNNGSMGIDLFGSKNTLSNFISSNNVFSGVRRGLGTGGTTHNGISYNNCAVGVESYASSPDMEYIISDTQVYHNQGAGFSSSNTGVTYFGNLSSFGNYSNGMPSPAFTLGNTAVYPYFIAGVYSTGGLFDSTLVVLPTNLSGWNYQTNCRQTGLTWMNTLNFSYGSALPVQKRPVRYNLTTGVLEQYGVDGTDYDSTKKIGQW